MATVSDNAVPVLRVLVGRGHHHGYFFRPAGAEFQNTAVNLHGNLTRISHDHGLPCQEAGAVILVMIQYVIHQRMDGVFIAQNRVHPGKIPLAFLYNFRVRLFGQRIKFRVNYRQRVLIQTKFHYPALVIYRARRAVLDRLRHIVNVDIIAEDFPCAAVFGGNRRPRKTDVRRVWKAVANDSGGSHDSFRYLFPRLVLCNPDLFRQTILPPVGLVRHYHQIAAFRKAVERLLKLLHGGKDNSIRFPPRQKRS